MKPSTSLPLWGRVVYFGITANEILKVGCLSSHLLLCAYLIDRSKVENRMVFSFISFVISVFTPRRICIRLSARRTKISPPNSLRTCGVFWYNRKWKVWANLLTPSAFYLVSLA